MAVGTYALTTLAAVNSILKLTADGSTIDAFVENLVDRVTTRIEGFCDRKLAARDYVYTSAAQQDDTVFSGKGLTEMWLPQYPVNSVTTLIVDGTTISARTVTEWDDTGYLIHKAEGRIELVGYTFTEGSQNIYYTYNAGYSTIPDDLEYACAKQAAMEYEESGFANSARLGLSSKDLGDQTVNYLRQAGNKPLTWLPDVEEILWLYKRRVAL